MVEAAGDPAPGETEPDRMLPSGESGHTGGVDGPFDLDRRARLDRPGADRWRPSGAPIIGEKLMQVGEAQS